MKAMKYLLALGLLVAGSVQAQSFVLNTEVGDSMGGVAFEGQRTSTKPFILDRQGFVRMSPGVEQKDDFTGDTLNTFLWDVFGGTSSGGSPTITVSTSGIVSMTTGLSNTNLAGNSQLVGTKNWVANQGNLSLEARIRMNTSTSQVIAVGFIDQVTSTVPATISGTTTSLSIVSAGTPNYIGFIYDPSSSVSITTAGLARWRGVGIKDTVTGTAVVAGPNVTPSTFVTLRVNVGANGSAQFYVDGKPYGSLPAAAVNSATALAPIVGIDTTDATAKIMAVDYVQVYQKR